MAASLPGQQEGNLACLSDSRVEEPAVRDLHWQQLGRTQLQLDVCSCCNGCMQKAPSVEVTQTTVDNDFGSNISLGALPTKVVVQGSFISFGDDSASTTVLVDGQPCVLRNVTSYLIICDIVTPYIEGQQILVLRSDGSSAAFLNGSEPVPAQLGNETDTFPVFIGRGLNVHVINNVSTENGARASLGISLKSQPQAVVRIPADCSIDNDAEILGGPATQPFKPGKPSQTDLVFTTENWNVTQTLDYEGQDDFILSGLGSRPYSAILGPSYSDDINYNNRDSMTIEMENRDYECPVGNTAQQFTDIDGFTKTRCVCSAGWVNDLTDPSCEETRHHDPATCKCTKCLEGTYKTEPGNLPSHDCIECPMHTVDKGLSPSDYKMTLRLGSTDVSECVCKAKFVLLTNTTDVQLLLARNLTCISCDELCYDNLGQPDSTLDPKDPTTWCVDCAQPALELQQLSVRRGFWRQDINSSYVYRCPGDNLCLNTSGSIPTNITQSSWSEAESSGACYADSRNNQDADKVEIDGNSYRLDEWQNQCNLPCAHGSMGVMCTACDEMWAKDYRQAGGCSSCTESGQKLIMVAVVLLLVAVLGYGVYSSIQSAEDEDRTSTMLFKFLYLSR